MSYSMDMSQEKNIATLLPKGWREFEILSCVEHTSKAGNLTFKFEWQDLETESIIDVYAVGIPKKRWFLKMILKACKIEASKDGVYNWNRDDVINKKVIARIEHFQDTWINQKGQEVTKPKHKITEVLPLKKKVDDVWEDAVKKSEEIERNEIANEKFDEVAETVNDMPEI